MGGDDRSDSGTARERALVLYVDDDRNNRVVFASQMGGEFAVECVADGPAALEVMERQPVAVLVTDMRMPAMTGEELVRIVKERYPGTIRIVVTAYSDVDPILRAINEGLVARYILKPWNKEELTQALRWATETWSFSHDSAELHRRLIEIERLAMLGSIAGASAHVMAASLQSIQYEAEQLVDMAKVVPELRRLLAPADIAPEARKTAVFLLNHMQDTTAELEMSVKTVRGLHHQLYSFASIKTDRAAEVPPSTDVIPILRHAIAVSARMTERHSKDLITYAGPPELPPVRMSLVELAQVLINILTNAVQAVQARAPHRGRVEVSARQEDGVLELRVKDDGVGIPPEVLARIGRPFLTTREGGTGLGISQCQRLVGGAGGRLQIESAPGVGTTVTITLPVAA